MVWYFIDAWLRRPEAGRRAVLQAHISTLFPSTRAIDQIANALPVLARQPFRNLIDAIQAWEDAPQ